MNMNRRSKERFFKAVCNLEKHEENARIMLILAKAKWVEANESVKSKKKLGKECIQLAKKALDMHLKTRGTFSFENSRRR